MPLILLEALHVFVDVWSRGFTSSCFHGLRLQACRQWRSSLIQLYPGCPGMTDFGITDLSIPPAPRCPVPGPQWEVLECAALLSGPVPTNISSIFPAKSWELQIGKLGINLPQQCTSPPVVSISLLQWAGHGRRPAVLARSSVHAQNGESEKFPTISSQAETQWKHNPVGHRCSCTELHTWLSTLQVVTAGMLQEYWKQEQHTLKCAFEVRFALSVHGHGVALL